MSPREEFVRSILSRTQFEQPAAQPPRKKQSNFGSLALIAAVMVASVVSLQDDVNIWWSNSGNSVATVVRGGSYNALVAMADWVGGAERGTPTHPNTFSRNVDVQLALNVPEFEPEEPPTAPAAAPTAGRAHITWVSSNKHTPKAEEPIEESFPIELELKK